MNIEAERPDLDAADHAHGSLGPLAFLKAALPGGFSGAGLQLLAAWAAFQVVTSSAWAQHLFQLAGWSSLPTYWGEQLTARDAWELLVNGGLARHPLGFWTALSAFAFLAWALWAGWKVQARAVDLPARFAPWALGFLDACLLGILPNALVVVSLTWVLGKLGDTGIQGLGWLELVLGTLVRLVAVSAFLLQWWLCRINRAETPGWRMGSWGNLGRHLGRSFLRVWLHPVQWTAVLLGGVILRLGLHALVLALAWRLGGGTPLRVWIFLLLQALAAVGAAWVMGWALRTVAAFWRHDARLREEIHWLRRRAAGLSVEP